MLGSVGPGRTGRFAEEIGRRRWRGTPGAAPHGPTRDAGRIANRPASVRVVIRSVWGDRYDDGRIRMAWHAATGNGRRRSAQPTRPYRTCDPWPATCPGRGDVNACRRTGVRGACLPGGASPLTRTSTELDRRLADRIERALHFGLGPPPSRSPTQGMAVDAGVDPLGLWQPLALSTVGKK